MEGRCQQSTVRSDPRRWGFLDRQPAAPVVRPLPVVGTPLALREFILSRPADEDGAHIVNCVLPKFVIETSGGNITPLVILLIKDFTISLYIEYCGDAEPNGYLVDATNVTTSVLCDDIPCATSKAAVDDVINYLREVADDMATDGYEVDEIMTEDRGYAQGARVDVLVNF